MTEDRIEICEIITNMLDNPGECGIYPTTKAYKELELLVNRERLIAIACTFSYACSCLDEKKDIRKMEIPVVIAEILSMLSSEQ